jgi:diaminohydroxyphosphoribosylaminopyrimidine deaminase / 5-amino-6-(5-phosphoribosylamino)uracil reductase
VVIVSTADHSLGAPGVVALRPGLAAALADSGRYAVLDRRRHGSDTFTTYERIA